MNSENESINNFHSWPFAQFSGLNGPIFASDTLPFHGVNLATLSFNPHYLQIANALQWPILLPRTQEHLSIPRQNSPRSPSEDVRTRSIDSIPSHGLTETVEQKWRHESTKETIQSSALDLNSQKDCSRLTSSKDFFASISNHADSSEEKNDFSNSINSRSEKPFLKFGVQAILSKVSPSTGKL